MISRYDYAKTKLNSKNKQVLATLTVPTIADMEDDVYIITSVTDRLDSLSFKYYGNAKYWWVIAVANNLGKGTLVVEPGIQIRIPANPSTIINEVENKNL